MKFDEIVWFFWKEIQVKIIDILSERNKILYIIFQQAIGLVNDSLIVFWVVESRIEMLTKLG